MENQELATLTITGDVARITLRRPPLNFLNMEMLRQIERHLESLGDSPPCRALVLDSEGPSFCAGLEMSEQTRELAFLLLEQFHQVVSVLNSFARPTIGVIRGIALGAGNELVAYCDFAIASEKATFGQPEIKVGSIPSLAPFALPALIGQRRALEMILTGRLLDAVEAQKLGLIHQALPEAQLVPAVEALLGNLRGLSSSVLEVALQAARGPRSRELESNLRSVESLFLNQLMDLEDTAEGVKAFLEKRTPKWKHK